MTDQTIIIDRVAGGSPELPEPVCGVGKQQLLHQIANGFKNLPFLLCGPSGCGKKSLVQIAAKDANLKVKGAYDLGQISSEMKTRYDDLVKVLSWYGERLQKNILGEKCLLVLYGAEHLDEKGAVLVRKYAVVLVANQQIKTLKAAFGDRTLWANRLTWQEMKRSLEILHPEAPSSQVKIATQLAGGDLRQAQIHITFGTTSIHRAKHVYFDVQGALCKGLSNELDWHSRWWASENHLFVDKSIEEHAAFSKSLVIASLIEDPDSKHAAPNCIGNIADVVAGMAVKELVGYKRTDFKLKRPPDSSRECQPLKRRKYPECRDDLKEYFAIPRPEERTLRHRVAMKRQTLPAHEEEALVGGMPEATLQSPTSLQPPEQGDTRGSAPSGTPNQAVSPEQPDEMRILDGRPECDLLGG